MLQWFNCFFYIIFDNIRCIVIRISSKIYITQLQKKIKKQKCWIIVEPIFIFLLRILQDSQLCNNFDADKLTSYAFDFAIIRSRGLQSKAFKKSFGRALNVFPLSPDFFHLSVMTRRERCALSLCRKPHWNSKIKFPKWSGICLQMHLS